ncbi:hypothetical protein [Okeania sp. SIO1I7]|nr:hypothetical protein [Okeania sp. SIO1I7]
MEYQRVRETERMFCHVGTHLHSQLNSSSTKLRNNMKKIQLLLIFIH